MVIAQEKLKELILNSHLVDEITWNSAEEEARRTNSTPIDILIGRRILTKDFVLDLASEYLKIPRVKLKQMVIPRAVLQLIPEHISSEKKVVPFMREKNKLRVAMATPQDLELIRLLENLTHFEIEPYLTSEEEIRYALTGHQEIKREMFEGIIEKEAFQISQRASTGSLAELAQEVSSVKIVDGIIGYASGLNASDVHIEALTENSLIRFRVDGVLREMMRVPKSIHEAIIARIKILANLQIDEHNKPQDGRIGYKIGDLEFDIRVSIMPTMNGEKAVFRLLASTLRPTSLDELGLGPEAQEVVESNMRKAFGMILVTGPTGSGKTTTLYTMMSLLNQPGVNICTIEDPIEYELPYVNQTQVNFRQGITFANGLRALFRQDPDIMMVGEVRDMETADIAVQAALTGHLLLSTLHTNDAPTAIPRLIDIGIQPFLIVATLDLVIAQRLVRKTCLDCISSRPFSAYQKEIIIQQLRVLGLGDDQIQSYRFPEQTYFGKGCALCGFSGYRGRTGIFQVLPIIDEIREVVAAKNFTLDTLRELGRKHGMKTMFEDGLAKLELGTTTLEEILRVIRE